ncbi:MAG: hypothetical protein ACO280_06555 [Pseudohongiellaceae bacterium]|jgi:uncharacterized membrane protein YhaH (DUF805 family)
MKYAVWFVRLVFAAWMIPAGLNHFIPLFPQPMGTQPLSQELIRALLDSGLFDLVKAVELVAGVGVLIGWYTPLMLVICLPVSFNVFYWDAPLEGWGSRAALFGYATFLCNALLCLAWFRSYRDMFALRATPARPSQVLVARVVFGAWMVLHAANILFLSLWAAPAGHGALATQLMTALVNSGLLDVAMTLQLLLGGLILAGVGVPAALCLLMPITTCALFWALFLDQQALTALLTLLAFALNALLMLAYLPYYRGVLERSPPAAGETADGRSHFDALFVAGGGRSSRAEYVPALVTVVAALAFFHYEVTGRTATFCMLMLVYPSAVLLSRRLRDLGQPVGLLALPLLLTLASFGVELGYLSLGAGVDAVMSWLALGVAGLFLLWGGVRETGR